MRRMLPLDADVYPDALTVDEQQGLAGRPDTHEGGMMVGLEVEA